MEAWPFLIWFFRCSLTQKLDTWKIHWSKMLTMWFVFGTFLMTTNHILLSKEIQSKRKKLGSRHFFSRDAIWPWRFLYRNETKKQKNVFKVKANCWLLGRKRCHCWASSSGQVSMIKLELIFRLFSWTPLENDFWLEFQLSLEGDVWFESQSSFEGDAWFEFQLLNWQIPWETLTMEEASVSVSYSMYFRVG